MAAARSIGLWMFRWRSRRRVVSVTRRYVDFLFNREETVMCAECDRPGAGDDCRCLCHVWTPRTLIDDTELQLPPSDESKVGDDV